MKIQETRLHGCYLLQPDVRADDRGSFVKTFHRDLFTTHGLATEFAESFYSVSHRGVLRGLHFQVPPHQHVKLVHCSVGRAFDAVVDLRRGSPTEGCSATFELSAEKGTMLYIPAGFAHGWYALVEGTQLHYQVTSVHSQAHDNGIHWDSAGVAWPDSQPVLSTRDAGLPPKANFDSPFTFDGSVLPGAVLRSQ